MTPKRFMKPNALPQYWALPRGPKIQSRRATTTGSMKCSTP
jgi:hypothetical protein